MRADIVARAPTRIDLGGGWTDVPPYCDREGGFVCNVAISRYSVVRLASRGVRPSSEEESDVPLVSAALRRSGVTDATVSIENDFPVGAGLGGSSAASAALLTALAAWSGRQRERSEIAEEGRRIEVEDLAIAGGRQDHYAAAFGGALALTFTSRTAVRRIVLPSAMRDEITTRCILVYTGQSRISGDTITAVLGAYERGEPRVVAALSTMRDLATQMATALDRGDFDAVGELVGEHWVHQRSLHPSIPTPLIDDIIARARDAGAVGAKALGASGGGSVLIVARRDNVARIREVVRPLGDLLPFDIDNEGATTVSDSG